jgi:metallo-beta-lactamase family protein
VDESNITFLGAAQRVTGSCSLVRLGGLRILVDCGMIQGGDDAEEMNRAPLAVKPGELDAVVLTHGHLDHTGRLPKLVADGYAGPIFAHPATGQLAEVVCRDSARLSESWENGPLYDEAAVERTLKLLQPVPYDQTRDLGGVQLTFHDAGHILGSCHAELAGGGRRLLMSGDVGALHTPILRDPTSGWGDAPRFDAVVVESTYGNRLHKGRPETLAEFEEIVRAAVRQRAVVLIPAFAIGRTQELLFQLRDLEADGRLPRVPVVLDSPMANRVTAIYREHVEDCYDEESRALIASGKRPLRPENLREVTSAEESKALKKQAGPMIIVAGSGMCTGGRILHHLKDFLPRKSTTVMFVGWQGQGTLGRRLVDGAKNIRIRGEPVEVLARIATLNGFSAHADRDALVAWARKVPGPVGRFLVNHGEPDSTQGLVAAFGQAGLGQTSAVEMGQTYAF